MTTEPDEKTCGSPLRSGASPEGYFDHSRQFQDNTFVYPVLSRRSKGISVGVNLFPCKQCNFDCLYCQVRSHRRESKPNEDVVISLPRLKQELKQTLERVISKRLYGLEAFRSVPESLRRLNDIALSGDGEPTLVKAFPEICQACADVKAEMDLAEVKIILLTNATLLHLDYVQQGISILYKNRGEIWAKLDAGTESYFSRINQTKVPFKRVLDNITEAAKAQPIVVQTLFARIDQSPPPSEEAAAYADQLVRIIEAGGKIRLIQLHTLARPPRDPRVSRLSRDELEAIAGMIRERVSAPLETYYQ